MMQNGSVPTVVRVILPVDLGMLDRLLVRIHVLPSVSELSSFAKDSPADVHPGNPRKRPKGAADRVADPLADGALHDMVL